MRNSIFPKREPGSNSWLLSFSWEQRKLGDIAIFNPKSELPEKFEYVDLESVVGTEIIAHREEQKSTAPSRAQRLAQFGDLFYQTVRPYQKNNCLFESHCKSYVFSTGYAQIRPFFNGYFLLSLVQSDFFVKRVLDRCTGTSYPAINSNDLAEMSIKKPCDKKEIEKIGQFFRSLDRLITLHQCNYFFNATEMVSRNVEKTFSWEQRKVNEIADIVGGGTPSTHNPSYWDGDINWYAPAEMEGKRYAVTSERKITQAGLSNSSAKILPAGRTILFTSRAGIGKVAILQHDAATNQGFQSLVLKDGISPYFIYSMGSILKKKAEGIASGSTFLEISGKMLGNIDITIPISSEQHIIADFFRNLDDLITLHQRECFFSRIRKKLKITSQKTNAWEQRELGMVGSFYYGHSCPKWSVTEDATTPCIRYGELYTKFGTIVDRVFSYTSMPSEKLRFSKGTEVLIPRVGEDPMDYNHCTWLSLKGIAIGEMISVFNSDQNPLFMAIMFNATLQQEFAMRVEGGSVTNLYFEKLKNIEVKYPLISEQQKIGQFFQSIDRLITLHQRERLFLILEEILC